MLEIHETQQPNAIRRHTFVQMAQNGFFGSFCDGFFWTKFHVLYKTKFTKPLKLEKPAISPCSGGFERQTKRSDEIDNPETTLKRWHLYCKASSVCENALSNASILSFGYRFLGRLGYGYETVFPTIKERHNKRLDIDGYVFVLCGMCTSGSP